MRACGDGDGRDRLFESERGQRAGIFFDAAENLPGHERPNHGLNFPHIGVGLERRGNRPALLVSSLHLHRALRRGDGEPGDVCLREGEEALLCDGLLFFTLFRRQFDEIEVAPQSRQNQQQNNVGQ